MTTDRAEAVSLARNALHDEPVSIKEFGHSRRQ